jgi:glycosyltransferase involved in cell wall biosynthesis
VREFSLGERVVLEGRRTRDEVATLLREADVVVTPSVTTRQGDREGIPVAVMEAMASGVAVVASDLSGIPELVADGRNGLLVPPGDAPALAEAIRRLLGDPELRRQLGANGRATVVEEFDVRRNAAQLAHLLEAVHE